MIHPFCRNSERNKTAGDAGKKVAEWLRLIKKYLSLNLAQREMFKLYWVTFKELVTHYIYEV